MFWAIRRWLISKLAKGASVAIRVSFDPENGCTQQCLRGFYDGVSVSGCNAGFTLKTPPAAGE